MDELLDKLKEILFEFNSLREKEDKFKAQYDNNEKEYNFCLKEKEIIKKEMDELSDKIKKMETDIIGLYSFGGVSTFLVFGSYYSIYFMIKQFSNTDIPVFPAYIGLAGMASSLIPLPIMDKKLNKLKNCDEYNNLLVELNEREMEIKEIENKEYVLNKNKESITEQLNFIGRLITNKELEIIELNNLIKMNNYNGENIHFNRGKVKLKEKLND